MIKALAAFAALLIGTTAHAQASAVHRETLQELPFPAPSFHTVSVRATIDPGGIVANHTHPGIEMAYVVSGEAALDEAGKPLRALHTGDSFAIPEGTVHSVKNVGQAPLILLSTYIVQVGKPLVIPAP